MIESENQQAKEKDKKMKEKYKLAWSEQKTMKKKKGDEI